MAPGRCYNPKLTSEEDSSPINRTINSCFNIKTLVNRNTLRRSLVSLLGGYCRSRGVTYRVPLGDAAEEGGGGRGGDQVRGVGGVSAHLTNVAL